MELHSRDGNLAFLGVVDFQSLIWIERFNRVGTCEIFAPATERNRNILKIGNYIERSDVQSMVCRIVDVKEKGNPDEGVFITAIGYDAKYYLDNRVNISLQIFSSDNAGADLETWITNQLRSGAGRRLYKPNGNVLMVFPSEGSDAGGIASQKVFGLTHGRMCREICGSLGFGYRFSITDRDGTDPTPDNLPAFMFQVYAGEDRRSTVVFSRENQNLGNMEYEHDIRNLGNVCYIQNPEVRYEASVLGNAVSTNRVEKFLETSVTNEMSYGEIRNALEGTWTLLQVGSKVNLSVRNLYVPVLSGWQLSRLQSWVSGDTTSKPGYYHVTGPVVIASCEAQLSDVTDDTSFVLINQMYDYVQLCAGVEHLNGFKETERTDVEILNNFYGYREDYFLGDIVTISHDTEMAAQILEVMECFDQNGYHLEPRTSYTDVEQE